MEKVLVRLMIRKYRIVSSESRGFARYRIPLRLDPADSPEARKSPIACLRSVSVSLASGRPNPKMLDSKTLAEVGRINRVSLTVSTAAIVFYH